MTIQTADCLDALRAMPPGSVDAVVTDPPYEIGFLDKAWDAQGIAHKTQLWASVWYALKPGGYLAAFGATRTYHRLATAIESAGFDIRDSLAWLYGSGFPKSHNDGPRGTALKPAWEPIVVAQKPKDGTYANNYEQHGTGYMNIDDARVPLNGDSVHYYPNRPEYADTSMLGIGGKRRAVAQDLGGRWPANGMPTTN